MGYLINSKGDKTDVTGWAEFKDEKNEKMIFKAGELLLDSLKRYAEYINEGGDPEAFDKKAQLVSP